MAHGAYLLRTNCPQSDPSAFWQWYIQLQQAEAAFRSMNVILPLKDRGEARLRVAKPDRPVAELQYLVKTAHPSGSGNLLPYRCSWVFENGIERAWLVAVALAAIVVLTSCSSTDTGFSERLISPVPNNQQATNSKHASRYQPPRSPGFDPVLFGS